MTIVVASGKGGVGKTSITAGVASALSAMGKSVVCVDADIGMRNLDIALGLQNTALFDFGDVLENRVALKDALTAHPSLPGLYLLPAPSSSNVFDIDKNDFKKLISVLSKKADFVFVDCPAGIGEAFTLASEACRTAIVVTTPNSLAITNAAICAGKLRTHDPIFLVVNQVNPKLQKLHHAETIDDIMDEIGLPLLGLVPEDEMVVASQNHHIPVILSTQTGASAAYANIAERLCGNNCPLPRKLHCGTVDA